MIDAMRLGEPQIDPVAILKGSAWYSLSAINKQPVVRPAADQFQFAWSGYEF